MKETSILHSTSDPTILCEYNSILAKGAVYRAGAMALLRSIPSNHADIVFLDPPFNIGKDYGNGSSNDSHPAVQYHSWLHDVIRESFRVLDNGGALYVYHLPETATRIVGLLNSFLQFRHWIAISMKSTFARGKRLYPAHYALLYYTKGEPKRFTRPKIEPKRCRTCKSLIKDYGGYRSIIEKKGINLSDIWDDLSPVRHNNRKHRDANELPSLLFERILAISGYPDGLYVDPFAGSGNGALAAIRAGMRFIVGDNSHEYCQVIIDRINKKISKDRA